MKITDVAAGLVFRNGKLLIAERHADAHLGGLWEFPGGKRESGETFEECLVRELREELGIEVEVGKLVESLTHEYPGKIVHLKFFHCEWRQHEPRAIGCASFAWVTANQLDGYTFPEADEQLLALLRGSGDLWGANFHRISRKPRMETHRKAQKGR